MMRGNLRLLGVLAAHDALEAPVRRSGGRRPRESTPRSSLDNRDEGGDVVLLAAAVGQHAGDAGYDLHAREEVTLAARGGRALVATGVAIAIPEGCAGFIQPRSGLALRHGVRLPVDDPSELYRFTGLNQFLDIYTLICRSLRTADDFRRITYEALEDGARVGVRYREMFFSPGFVTQLGVPVETVWDGMRAGLLDARRDLDIMCRLVLDFDKPSGVGHAEEMAAFAGAQDRDLLIGMGADSVERGIDHRAFAATQPSVAQAEGVAAANRSRYSRI